MVPYYTKTILSFLLVLIFSFSIQSQEYFKDKVENLRPQYFTSKKDSSKYYAAVKRIENEFVDSITQCPYNYLLLKNLGAYYYEILADDHKVIQVQSKVLEIQSNCLNALDPQIAITHFNIGKSLYWLGQKKEAENEYVKALEIQNLLKEPHYSSSNQYSQIGEFYETQGDHAKAFFYYDKAENTHLGEEDVFFRDYLRSKALLLDKEKRHKEAIPILFRALKISQNLKNVSKKYEAYIYEDISRQYRYLKNYSEAETYVKKAITLGNSIEDFTLQNMNNFLTNYSHIKKETGKFKEAEDLLLKVRKSYNSNLKKTSLRHISGNYENMGDLYFQQTLYEKALDNYQDALKLLDNNLSEEITSNPNIENRKFIGETYLLRQLGLKAKALYALGQQKNNIDLYKTTINTINKYDSLNQRVFKKDWDEKSYLRVLDQNREFYHLGFMAALNVYTQTNNKKYLIDAYNIVTKLKSQLLYRGIKLNESSANQISEELQSEEKRLQDSVTTHSKIYQSLLSSTADKRKAAFDQYSKFRIELNLFQKKHGRDQILENMEINTSIKLAHIQNKLKPSEVLLELYLQADSLYSFIITREDIYLDKSFLNSKKIIEYYGNLTIAKPNSNLFQESLSAFINDLPQTKLIIIPDQELLQIPFEALMLTKEKKWLDKFEISYQYGSEFLVQSKEIIPNQSLANFGSDYNKSRFSKYNSTVGPKENQVSELRYTLGEIKKSNKVIGGSLYQNEEATKINFSKSLGTSGIYHFALHGKLNKSNPDLSSLVFESSGNDFELSASEIYNMKIPSNLTVLSACNSGVGPVEVGDGVRSLTRSFIHAGSRSVITSLWESSDASTMQILERFYIHLKSGKRKSEALRIAKLEYLESASPTFQNPKYWAHLVLVGDDDPLFSGSFATSFSFIIFGILLMLMAFLWLNKKR